MWQTIDRDIRERCHRQVLIMCLHGLGYVVSLKLNTMMIGEHTEQ
jgi:hypothetical protein